MICRRKIQGKIYTGRKDKKVQDQTIAVQRVSDNVNSANAKLNAAKTKLANATVTATMDGTVQTIGILIICQLMELHSLHLQVRVEWRSVVFDRVPVG